MRHDPSVGRATRRAPAGLVLLVALLAALPVAGEPDDYRLGPGDVLSVTVLRHPDLSAEVTVTSDGRINLPVVGELRVEGRTVAEVTRTVTLGLGERLLAPEVTVAVRQARTQSVFVLGAVASPGVYALERGWRVTEALAAAGGLRGRPEQIAGSLMRSAQPAATLELEALLADAAHAANLPLQAGDVLSFTERTLTLSVAGAVLRPGAYEVPAGSGLLEALARAGGVAPHADLSRVRVQSTDGAQREHDLRPVLLEGEPAPAEPLAGGDMVIVPESRTRVAVLGAVRSPGYFDLPPNETLRVAEAVAQAGGLINRPELIQGSIFRRDGEAVPLEISAIFVHGQAAANLPLQAGDVISLAERTLPISVAGQVARPGAYELPVGGGVVEAVALAGGLGTRASLRSVVVKHSDGSEQKVDLFAVMAQGELAGNLPLQAGDLVMVPEASAKVAVLGAVNRPGYYDLDENLTPTVSQVVAQAGGAVRRARLGETAIVREQEGEPIRLTVDLGQVLHGGRTEADLPVQSGDVIYIPDAAVDWDLALRALSAFSFLRWIF